MGALSKIKEKLLKSREKEKEKIGDKVEKDKVQTMKSTPPPPPDDG